MLSRLFDRWGFIFIVKVYWDESSLKLMVYVDIVGRNPER